jgi:hypothetical protein
MQPIPVIGIPSLNQSALLQRCLDSIDYPVAKLVVVHNTLPNVSGALQLAWPRTARETTLIRHPNAGVAGSWNEIVKLFPAPYWLLVNDDIQFAAGDLQRMAESAEQNPLAGCLYGNHGASWWVITKHGIAEAGWLDENIFPAYLEDTDMAYRMDLLRLARVNVPGCASIHGVPGQASSCTVNCNPTLKAENMRTHGKNFTYYIRKWGGINGQERFKTPFNDPHWPIWAWKFEPDHRAAQQWKRL